MSEARQQAGQQQGARDAGQAAGNDRYGVAEGGCYRA
jgi:hypothetical protein